jgi:hypothetical protein
MKTSRSHIWGYMQQNQAQNGSSERLKREEEDGIESVDRLGE